MGSRMSIEKPPRPYGERVGVRGGLSESQNTIEARAWPYDDKEFPLIFLGPLGGRGVGEGGNSLELEGETEKKSYLPERCGVL